LRGYRQTSGTGKKNKQKAAAILTLLAGLTAASVATAAPISGLFNTDASLAADGAVDPHWLANSGSAYVYNHPAYLIDPNARFIAVTPGGGYSSATNTYTLSFDLTGFNPLTASLSGGFAGDNWADASTAVPEPFTLSLFGAGLAGAVALRRRKSAKVA
jgi:hypothetical protein